MACHKMQCLNFSKFHYNWNLVLWSEKKKKTNIGPGAFVKIQHVMYFAMCVPGKPGSHWQGVKTWY